MRRFLLVVSLVIPGIVRAAPCFEHIRHLRPMAGYMGPAGVSYATTRIIISGLDL